MTTLRAFMDHTGTRPHFARDEANTTAVLMCLGKDVQYTNGNKPPANKKRIVIGSGKDDAAALWDLLTKIRGHTMHTARGNYIAPWFI